MKNNIFTIFKKEMARFFKDKRLVITTILLPGIMIYAMYTFMGTMMSKQFSVADDYVSKIYVKNMPESLKAELYAPIFEIKDVKDKIDEEKGLVKEKLADALIIFPENFDEAVDAYEAKAGGKAPSVEIYYNSAREESSVTYEAVSNILEQYETKLSNKFDVNLEEGTVYDLAAKEDMTGKMLGSLLPMLLMIFIWSGCMAVAPESIAGEKERGTIATLLVTPMRRGDLALGKIMALSIIALLSGISSFIGTFMSLPAMYQGMSAAVDVSFYGVTEFALLFAIIITTTLFMVAIISVISAFAKSVKEAATLMSPLMMIIMIMSFLPMIMDGESGSSYAMFFIPLYNNVLCMHDIFTFSYSTMNVAVSMAVNLVCIGGMIFLLTKMFNSEKVMFSK